MIFDFQAHIVGALGYHPKMVGQDKLRDQLPKRLGIPARRFRARLVELQKLAMLFRNTNNPKDKGMRRLAAAVRRHPTLTQDDIYRVFQMDAVFNYCCSHNGEPGSGDNWAWRTPMDEYAIDIFMLMVSRTAFMETPECADFECGMDEFFKRNGKRLTQAVKFRRKLLAD